MAGSFRQPIRGQDLSTAAKQLKSQYGYDGRANRSRGFGPGSHYVFPDIFGAGSENGLSPGTGLTVPLSGIVTSQTLDLSGWSRWALYISFPVAVGAAGGGFGVNIYTDPYFKNLWTQPAGLTIPAAATTFYVDSQAGSSASQIDFTPYITFAVSNSSAVATFTMRAVLFVFDYMRI